MADEKRPRRVRKVTGVAAEKGAADRRANEWSVWARRLSLSRVGRPEPTGGRKRRSQRAYRRRRHRFTLKRSPHVYGPHQDNLERVEWARQGRLGRKGAGVSPGKRSAVRKRRVRARVELHRRRPELDRGWSWSRRPTARGEGGGRGFSEKGREGEETLS